MSLGHKWKVVDSHLHFWKLNRGDYLWLTPELGGLYRDYLPDDWQNECSFIDASKAVVIQAAPTDAETDFLLSLAKQSDSLAGVVGWVDMNAEPLVVSERLQQLAAEPKFKGIRPMLQDIEDVEWILNPAFSPILNFLAAHNLCFDALVRKQHLDAILDIAQRYPTLKIVIDHCAKPNISEENFGEWATSIARFSALQNVYVKVSGLSTEASKEQQLANHYRGYFELMVTVFGPQRMMWGSDWPVVNINSNYMGWFDLSRELVSSWSQYEQTCFWSGTAIEFYRLNEE